MYIGILVHSETGHTLSVAERIKTHLTEQGHTCRIERVSAVGETPESHGQIEVPVKLNNPPDASPYDAVILGAPVWGFSLSKVMAAYALQLPNLAGKKTGCFVTQHLSRPIFGGNRSLRKLTGICQQKGAQVYASGIVNWSGERREEQIQGLVLSFARIG